MRLLDHVSARLMRPDMAQLLTLFLAVLVVVVGFSWPSAGGLVNESWFSLAPARSAILALAAAGFGASQGLIVLPGRNATYGGDGPARLAEARVTLGALLVWALITMPLEVVSHAASYPATNLAWSIFVSLLTVPAFYGLGMALRKGAALLRASWALPILVPGAVFVGAWLDLRFETALFNPWTAPLAPSLYPAVAGATALLTVIYLAGPWRSRAGPRAESAATSGGARA